jgi:hypothetical protein
MKKNPTFSQLQLKSLDNRSSSLSVNDFMNKKVIKIKLIKFRINTPHLKIT